jgi:hypothetical protein
MPQRLGSGGGSMKQGQPRTSTIWTGLLALCLTALPGLAWAASPPDAGTPLETAPASSPKDEAVKKYIQGCRSKPGKDANCDNLMKEAVEILKEDLHTLGSSANRTYMPTLLKIFKKDEPELKIAAADAIGMIGPQDSDVELLAPFTNDPVPDVRSAVTKMLQHGKGSAITLLGQRTSEMRIGLTPDTPADPGKYAMPVAPNSTYLFYASAAQHGRLSYVAEKGLDSAIAFFRGKAKKGPLKLDEFNQLYKYQLRDEEEARDKIRKEANDASNMQMKAAEKNMMSNPQAMVDAIAKQQGETMSQIVTDRDDRYPSEWFDSPNVVVLEERQIGQRSYPTRYVVLYLDKALRKASYRLSWMTVPDDAIKGAQVASLAREKEEAARNKENEALKKRAEALDNLTKKKDEQEKSKFKKGQADLEKELGF